MIEKIKTAIANAIRTVYSQNEYEIRTEDIEQGFKEPCFFIILLTQIHTQGLGTHFQRQYSFDVRFFPQHRDKEQSEAVAEELYSLLEYIQVDDGYLRGTGMHSQTTDYVLHFFVDYSITGYVKNDDEYMEEVNYIGKVKK
ncbi:MAG: hypothetical protein LKJ75_02545 [Clostridia bacterium]|jgi:hypothetical protein|nr:hypothetical protein [Clostridia bacterium]MCI2014063.1 hypothetical protein [Clostridia bacterium]